MATLQLSREDTYRLVLYSKKAAFFRRGQRFVTRTAEKCLGCRAEIFVSFTQSDNSAAFCDACKARANPKNMVQSQYMRIIKERQLELLEGASKHIMDDIGAYRNALEGGQK